MFRIAALLLLLGAAGALAQDPVSFKIVFGDKRDRAADYSGTIRLTSGKVVNIAPWRFYDGDAVDGTAGWKLNVKRSSFEDQPDNPTPMMTSPAPSNVVPEGVEVTVKAPATALAQVRTKQGGFDIPLASLKLGRVLTYAGGDVIVRRTPNVERVSEPSRLDPVEQFDYPSVATAPDGTVWIAWQGYHNEGDHVYVRHSTDAGWSPTERLTDNKGDIYRTATAVDGKSRVWVVWSERHGTKWDLYARRREGSSWSARQKITTADYPNIFHSMVADRAGNLHLVWVAHRDGKSFVAWSKLTGDAWSAPRLISGPSAWNPEAAADSAGNLWVAWDSYRTGNYDIFLRQVGAGGVLGEEMQVTKSPLMQNHVTVAVDGRDRVWLAWHESGANWGKDWTHEDSERGTVLYTNRRPKVAVLDAGKWKQPATDLITAVPLRYRRYVQYPRLAVTSDGRIWCGLQVRTSVRHNRSDYWAFDGRWEHFLTTLDGDHWTPLMPVPESSLRPEGPLLLRAAGDELWLTWTNDNRAIFAPGFYAFVPNHNEIFATRFSAGKAAPAPRFEPFAERMMKARPVHVDEPGDLARIRAYRTTLDGKTYRILRGDFHRHTEISTDGAGDGSIEDYFRYMIDAAGMETGILGDHNIGNNDEYMWWRTEKACDLFHIPGRYTPMFGYERSPSYPNGHRNVVFDHRGVHTLPIPAAEMHGKIRSGPIIYPYLRKNHGIAMVHSSATSQGTDWGDNDPELEPLVELYQGYHASAEYEGAPRAESDHLRVMVHGAYKPLGMWWKALEKGYKLGVQSSSDHISTHTSYTLIYTPSDSRSDILESMRSRHAYAATDNIIIDYQAETADGGLHFMGDALKTSSAPTLKFKIAGTDVIAKVDIVKDETFVYHAEPNQQTVEFTFRDSNVSKRESYYYVRIQQRDRNLAWSSPIWVDYR